MPIMEGTQKLKTAQGEYDFAVDGGAISSINMRCLATDTMGGEIPNGAVIEGGYIEVDTILAAAAGGTIAVNSEAAGDLQAAAIFSGAPWSTTGRKAIVPVFTAATTVKTTAKRQLQVTIATGAVTAGKFRVVVFYK